MTNKQMVEAKIRKMVKDVLKEEILPKKLTENTYDAKSIRSIPGWVGNDVAEKFDNEDLAEYARLKTEITQLINTITPIVKKMNEMRKTYKLKPLAAPTFSSKPT